MSETMMGTSLFGMLYSLVAGQPLMIMGPTGPVLVFEEALFKVRKENFILLFVLCIDDINVFGNILILIFLLLAMLLKLFTTFFSRVPCLFLLLLSVSLKFKSQISMK